MFDINTAIWMFPVLFALVFLGVPVTISLLVTSLVFGLDHFWGTFPTKIHSSLRDTSSNFILAAIPLFIFMGAMLERSGIAQRLFVAVRVWLGGLRGGLALTTIVMCAIFAMSSGVVGAVEIVVGLMAVPAMLEAGYKKDLAAGSVCAGGSLGTMIPPSVSIIIYASIVEMSVGDLFAGIMLPAVAMVTMFMLYIIIRCLVQPDAGPGLTLVELQMPLGQKLWLGVTSLIPALALVVMVLGSIFAGVASPTEAAAVGSFGSVLLTIAYGRFTWQVLYEAILRTIKVTSMVMMIVIGGVMFSGVFILSGGDTLVEELVKDFELTAVGVIIMFLAIIFLLGFIMDFISVLLIALPVFDPLVRSFDIDPIWFGVMVCIGLQTSYLTPPMAPSIFYLRSIAPPDISYTDMYKGVAPFVVIQLLTLLIVAFVPWTATMLPKYLFQF